jgi:hypothetical protein
MSNVNTNARTDSIDLGSDILWGSPAIAEVVGIDVRQVHRLLKAKQLPAKKVGGQWCASRTGLRKFFSSLSNVDAL